VDITGLLVELGPLELLLGAFLVLLAIIWLIVPFVLFGLGRRIKEVHGELARTREAIVAEQRRTNQLLAQQVGAAPSAPPLSPRSGPQAGPPPIPLSAREREEMPVVPHRPLVARRD
jgi:hypothetical protein